MLVTSLIFLLILLLPGDALAWGPITHIVHGSAVLASLETLPTHLQSLLAAYPSCYLYGCVGADLIQAKAYTRDVAGHCHRWPTAWRVVEAAATDRERAFVWGYMTHLAADILSHNHFVPGSLVRSFAAPALGHAYWEARVDAMQPAHHRVQVRRLLADSFEDCDALIGRVVADTLLSLKTNKRIFDSLLALSKLDRWQGFMSRVAARSRYTIGAEVVERYNEACIESARDLLSRGKESSTQSQDPTGQDVLTRAIALRRRLRALRRSGRLDADLAADIEETVGFEESA